MLVLEVRGLKKYYKEIRAVDSISFSIEKSEIFALLGPNGAGKTTTIKCILGLRFKDSGEIIKNGKIAYLPEGKELYQSYTVKKMVEFTADLTEDFDKSKCYGLIEKFDLPLSEKVSELSNGQTTQLYLALVLSQKADLYILDEPTWGLDPIVRNQILDAIRNIPMDGGSVLYTSHILSEVEKVADKVAIMNKGKIIEIGYLDDIKEKYCAIKVEKGKKVEGYKYKSTKSEDIYIVTKDYAKENKFEYELVTFDVLFEAFIVGSNTNGNNRGDIR
ncbi:multidrug ABC transporter ATP-binding protein [Fervidobacterium sp. 2310opik-2]|nr:multidrug ABC transporter ATP-binding protein [Fervidobacterium sp. 2310opik-2]